MIRVIIVDDHQMFIDGIKTLLEQEPSIHIVGHALNGQALLALLEKKNADLILMDIHMPVMNGIEATKIVHKKFPETKIIMLSMHNTKQYITSMITAGASGYILKTTGKEELIKAIEAVHQGGTYYSAEVTSRVMDSFRKKDMVDELQLELTKREKDVLQLLAQDLTAAEIAKILNISHHTVDAHRKNMLSKFNARTTVGLVKMAMEHDLLDNKD